jgi:hypothetical protein
MRAHARACKGQVGVRVSAGAVAKRSGAEGSRGSRARSGLLAREARIPGGMEMIFFLTSPFREQVNGRDRSTARGTWSAAAMWSPWNIQAGRVQAEQVQANTRNTRRRAQRRDEGDSAWRGYTSRWHVARMLAPQRSAAQDAVDATNLLRQRPVARLTRQEGPPRRRARRRSAGQHRRRTRIGTRASKVSSATLGHVLRGPVPIPRVPWSP